ncbi:MAG: beta-lactamase family protein [Acidobacteriota bacterium]|nr:beta-lactamase family protein [Acidobacteriota bacterium]
MAAVALHADPAGLWAAKGRFGPDLRGNLTMERGSGGWRAEIAGYTASVAVKGDVLQFEIPGGGGFRGSLKNDRMVGYWIQPGGNLRFATPVMLRKIDGTRWRGVVAPLDDVMTYFIPIQPNGDAFLRNPERNAGRFVGIQHAMIEGSTIKFLAADKTVIAQSPFDGDSFSIPIRGATLDFHRANAAEEAVFYARGRNPERYVYRKPPAEDDGWPVATVDEVGISRDAITKFVQMIIETPVEEHSVDLHAVLIARHGKLVLEEYFHGFGRDQLHDTRSASKSLTSMLIGAAMLHGVAIDASTSVYGVMDRGVDDPQKRAMTLENLLTMSSGLDCDDNDPKSPGQEDTMQSQTEQPDWYRFTLDLKMIRKPGEKAVYCSCQPNLAGGVLARISNRWQPDLIRDWIATPLQFGRYAVDLQPNGEAYMGGGARYLPRDFMKLGQVMLDGGKWKGRQIIPAAWAKKSTSPLYDLLTFHYGYLWWSTDYPYNGRNLRAFFAAGNGGQIVIAIPELDLLINFWGGNYSDRAGVTPQRVYVPQNILPAVK